MIITRKIQVAILEEDNDKKNDLYQQLHKWRFICRQAANIISSHRFTQDNIKDYIYLTEEVKVKLADASKDEEGIFQTSSQNSCYQVLSKRFKGEIPTSILSSLNQNVSKTYKEEKPQYFTGERSLRNYRKNIPVPFGSRDVSFFECKEDLCFDLFKINFKMLFGRDRSGNEAIVRKIMKGEFKLCSSSITYDLKKKKWFLLLCVDIPKRAYKPKEGQELNAFLDVEIPIKLMSGNNAISIGTKEDFLYQRLQIQSALRRLQANLRYARSGRGRKSKLKAIDRFKKKEKNYVSTKLHTYSKILILEAKRLKAETINLIDQKQSEEDAKENPFILRNWSYYGLLEKIKYKASREGINVKIS